MKARLLVIVALVAMLSGCIVVPARGYGPGPGYYGHGYYGHGGYYRGYAPGYVIVP